MLRPRPAICIVAAAAFVLFASLGAVRAEERQAGVGGGTGMSLSFKVSEAAVQKLLPDGWESAPLTAGPWQGANLFVSFAEWASAEGPDDKKGEAFALGSISTPVRPKGSNQAVAMVLTGLVSSRSYVPGPFSAYSFAKVTVGRHFYSQPDVAPTASTESTTEAAVPRIEEGWQFIGDNDDTLELQIVYQRAVDGFHVKSEGKIYSAVKPDFYRINRDDFVIHVIRSTPMDKNFVQNYTFKATGARWSALFDGSEQLIGIASLPWLARQIVPPSDMSK
jgi:hypothetical protein